MNTKWLTILRSFTSLLTTTEAWAHRPVGIGGDIGKDLDHAIEINDISVSQVIYRKTSSELPLLWMMFEGQAGQYLDVQLGIPVIEPLKAYRPSLVVIGPGLPEVALPFEIPEGFGGEILVSSLDRAEFFYEPFSDTNSWILGNLKLSLPEDGQYFIVAYHPQEARGKLWMALGKREEFSAADMVMMPEWLKAVREFHEVNGQAPLVNYTYVMILGLLATVSFVIWEAIKK